MKYDIIIAHHRENSYRERNLIEIIKYYSEIIPKDSYIIVVEQNTETELEANPQVIHIKEKYDTEYFWKTKLLNTGIKHSDKEAFCIVDSDAVVSQEAINYLSDIRAEFLSLMFPYNKVKMMNEADTRKWIRNGTIPTRIDKSYQKYDMCYTGFFMAMSRHTYERINGFDECYVGWGGEDDAIVIKVMRTAKIDKIPFESLVMHLYHPRKDNPEYVESVRHRTNELYTYALKTMPLDIFNQYLNEEITIDSFIDEKKIDSSSMIKRIHLKNGNYTDIAVKGIYPMPDNENGEFSIATLFKGLYMLLNKDAFIVNTQRLIDGSDDEDEKINIRKLVHETIMHFENETED